MPKRCCSHGAATTEKNATRTPQAKKTQPSWVMDSAIGNGAYPSIVKKPQL